MDYIKIRFGGGLEDLEEQFEKNLQEMLRSMTPRFTCGDRSWSPPMDIFETPEEIIIFAEVAGVKKEDLDIEINSKAVKIAGRRHDKPHENMNNVTYLLAEIQCGAFERVLYLPKPINTEKVQASCTDGMLRINLAKLPADKTHKIAVSEE